MSLCPFLVETNQFSEKNISLKKYFCHATWCYFISNELITIMWGKQSEDLVEWCSMEHVTKIQTYSLTSMPFSLAFIISKPYLWIGPDKSGVDLLTDHQWVCWDFPQWIRNWKYTWCAQMVVFLGYNCFDWLTTHLGIFLLWKLLKPLYSILGVKEECSACKNKIA